MAEEKISQSVLMSALKADYRDKLAKHCAERIRNLRGGMTGWLERRKIYARQAADDFSYRVAMAKPDGEDGTQQNDIFCEHNDSLNIIGGFSEYLAARATDDILGSDPFYALQPQGARDKNLAEGLQKHSSWKLRQSDLKSGFDDAVKKAFDLGEGILKVRWRKVERFFERRANVLVVKSNGRPILTKDRDYIFEQEIVVEREPSDDPAKEGKIVSAYPKNHPEISLVGKQTDWKEMIVEDSVVVYENISCRCLNHADLVVSLLAPSIEEMDFIGHLFDSSLHEIQRNYRLTGGQISQIKTATKEAITESAKPESKRGEGRSEDTTEAGLKDPTIQLCECYLDYVIRGKSCRVMAVIAVEAEILLWCDHLANVTPNGKMPFVVVRAWKAAENRWYGRGLFEACENDQLHIDRCLNQIGLRNSYAANPVKGIRPDCLEGVSSTNEVKLDPGEAMILKPDKNLRDAIQLLEIPDLDERTWQLMQLRMQTIQLRRGVTSAAQGGVESLPQNTTATGIEAILSSGNVLARKPINEIKAGLEAALLLALELMYQHQDRDETFTYLEGQFPEVVTISARDVANLSLNVQLTLTRFRLREMRENALTAMGAFGQYLQFQPGSDRDTAREFTVQVLKSVGFDNADSMVPKSSVSAAIVTPPAAL